MTEPAFAHELDAVLLWDKAVVVEDVSQQNHVHAPDVLVCSQS